MAFILIGSVLLLGERMNVQTVPFGNGERWPRASMTQWTPGQTVQSFLLTFWDQASCLPDGLNIYPKEGINSAAALLHMETDKHLFVDSEAGGRCL